jgi:hypothetical protein
LPGGVLEGIELRKRITKQEGGATKWERGISLLLKTMEK